MYDCVTVTVTAGIRPSAGVGVCMTVSVTVTAGIRPSAGVGVCMTVSVTVAAGVRSGAGVGVCMTMSVTVTAGIRPGAGVGVCMTMSVTVTAGIRPGTGVGVARRHNSVRHPGHRHRRHGRHRVRPLRPLLRPHVRRPLPPAHPHPLVLAVQRLWLCDRLLSVLLAPYPGWRAADRTSCPHPLPFVPGWSAVVPLPHLRHAV